MRDSPPESTILYPSWLDSEYRGNTIYFSFDEKHILIEIYFQFDSSN
ncbi:hypothetical protein KL86CLO1_10628 [uncultured Eubacteriales bacterium]|uniref:Uncharacterized protein n=1 Tax=uncultured Eubacteriales bacterium TaxID=172733 RepID=A0A212J791_9FIRM|nr:hypothetical protein KL86CLO1_10628 [uncultured Eubacteriales bacterium]